MCLLISLILLKLRCHFTHFTTEKFPPPNSSLGEKPYIYLIYILQASSWKETCPGGRQGLWDESRVTLVTSDLLPTTLCKDLVSLEETRFLQQSLMFKCLHAPALLLFSVTQSCLIFCDPMNCSTPGLPVLTICQSLPKFMFIASVVMLSSHLILWLPLLLLPSIFPSIRDLPALLLVKSSSRYQDGVPSR